MKRIAVITARADSGEQKNIILGITSRCLQLGYSAAIFSNIFNHPDEDNSPENGIYNYFNPYHYDGVIVTAEAFFNSSLLKNITDKIRKSGIPAAIIEGNADGFISVHSDDEEDFFRITEHLIIKHEITNIDILTGFKGNANAEKRLIGYKNALIKHGITVDKSKIHYGNFWNDSGIELAKKYLSGEIEMPEAVICGNDYMAFGLCDELISGGIKIPGQISVIGYEYTDSRALHYPIITTYRRARWEMGTAAVNLLLGMEAENPVAGEIISGNTCGCGADGWRLNEEIKGARIDSYHTVVSTVAKLGSNLTLCRSLSEYMSVIGEYMYLHHGASDLHLCIRKNWSGENDSDKFLCCGIENNPVEFDYGEIPPFLNSQDSAKVYCFSPFVFENDDFGFTALTYDYPTCCDFTYRDWNKTAVNALELLRMKNDIHYLRQCISVSTLYDALTGFYNEKEFFDFSSARGDISILSVGFYFTESEFALGENYRNDIISAVASAMKECCRKGEILGRFKDILAVIYSGEDELFFDRINAFISYILYSKGLDDKVMIVFSDKNDKNAIKIDIAAKIHNAEVLHKMRTGLTYYPVLSKIHHFAKSPKAALTTEQSCKMLGIGEGRFRVIYKECYGIAYTEDCIKMRLELAKYLLCSSSMSIFSIAMQCGYSDEKFFSRQFAKYNGISPRAYRNKS